MFSLALGSPGNRGSWHPGNDLLVPPLSPHPRGLAFGCHWSPNGSPGADGSCSWGDIKAGGAAPAFCAGVCWKKEGWDLKAA